MSPTQKVFNEFKKRGVPLKEMRALELFAHSGFLHTKDYQHLVASLEAWELDPKQEAPLRQNLPGADIKITDSYQEIRKTPHKYGLIVMDAPDCVHGLNGEYCEHFQIISEVFRVLTDSPVLLMNVMPGAASGGPAQPNFSQAHLEHRRRFYGTDHPDKVSYEEMLPVYKKLFEANGFELEWHLFRPRTQDSRLHYCAMKIRRKT